MRWQFFFHLLIIPENLDNFVVTLTVCDFHVRFSSRVTPRKSNAATLWISVPFIISLGIRSVISFWWGWKIIYFVFSVFRDNLFISSHSYHLDSYDHVADVWFVSYDHITKFHKPIFQKSNKQTNKAWHAKPRPMSPLYCVQIREHRVAYKRHNRPWPSSPSPTSVILYDRNCYDRICFPIVQEQGEIDHTDWAVCRCPRGPKMFNTLKPRQNGRHFADDIFKCIFVNENVRTSIKISLNFGPKGPINNISSLFQIMAWRRWWLDYKRIYASMS